MSEPPAIEFLDDVTSDVAFVARGPSLEAAFSTAADALLALTIDNPEAVASELETRVELAEPSLELLVLAFLGELVFLRDARGWLLRVDEIEVDETPGDAKLRARLVGEKLDPARHQRAADVKAVTAHRLGIARRDGLWEIRVTLDV
jgi:SHS2 domain-containing protein